MKLRFQAILKEVALDLEGEVVSFIEITLKLKPEVAFLEGRSYYNSARFWVYKDRDSVKRVVDPKGGRIIRARSVYLPSRKGL